MKWLAVLCAVCLCGCSVTVSGTARLREPAAVAPDAELRAKHEQLSTAIQSMTRELVGTSRDIDAVAAVLARYGIVVGYAAQTNKAQ